jgi:S-adenosylmethionine:tRNA ribosyltransferase-isomerase
LPSTGEPSKAWRERGVGFATLSHAAGLSSTGDAALDQRLPFDEHYRIPEACASAIEAAKSRSGRVIAIGTSVVRALESAASIDGTVRAGEGQARGRIARGARLRVVDAILTGVHQPGESHYELLRAFADDRVLYRVRAAVNERGYRTHEFGDSLLIERQARKSRCRSRRLDQSQAKPTASASDDDILIFETYPFCSCV